MTLANYDFNSPWGSELKYLPNCMRVNAERDDRPLGDWKLRAYFSPFVYLKFTKLCVHVRE